MSQLRAQTLASVEENIEMDDEALSHLIGYHIKRTSNDIHLNLRQALKNFGLSSITFSILTIITANRGIRSKELSRILDIEKSNLVNYLSSLESSGLISKVTDPGDGRSQLLHVTPEGERLQFKAYASVEDHENAFLKELDKSERKTLKIILKKIRSSLQSRY